MNSWIAQNRFGLGVPLGTIAIRNPEAWLLAQLSPQQALPSAVQSWKSSANIMEEIIRTPKSMKKMSRKDRKKQARQELKQIFWHGFHSNTPFLERVIMFFCNHLTVSAEKNDVALFVPSFQKEVVRANLHRGYGAMLTASTKHPAMLKYLDNIRSSGPDSKKGKRKKIGLNENLAREILELHSIGLESGYTQADVLAFSNILTGWSIPRNQKEFKGTSFFFRARVHQPGSQAEMGIRYAQPGVKKGERVLADLAQSKFTAQRLAYKLVQHFLSDQPDPKLVSNMAKAYLNGKDDIIAMLKEMIRAPESWAPIQKKLKRPDEYVLSTMRMLIPKGHRLNKKQQKQLLGNLVVMGQKPFFAPSPEGWSDNADEWLSGESMLRRLRFAELIAAQFVSEHEDIVQLAEQHLGPTLSEKTRLMIARAPSRKTALALLLSAPDFQRR